MSDRRAYGGYVVFRQPVQCIATSILPTPCDGVPEFLVSGPNGNQGYYCQGHANAIAQAFALNDHQRYVSRSFGVPDYSMPALPSGQGSVRPSDVVFREVD